VSQAEDLVRHALEAIERLARARQESEPWIVEVTLAVAGLTAETGKQLDLFAGRHHRRADLIRAAGRVAKRAAGAIRWSAPDEPVSAPLQPVDIRLDAAGLPIAVRIDRQWRSITVRSQWREAGDWWREGRLRDCYQALADETPLLLVRDVLAGTWLAGLADAPAQSPTVARIA
jgi:hypothetical protein